MQSMSSPPAVVLRKMSDAEWNVWYAQEREDYIEQMVASGRVSRADAVSKVDHDQAALLPDGPATSSHHFFVAEAAGTRVGMLWLAEQNADEDGSLAWVMKIETEPASRRRGYGRAIMLLAEEMARSRGHERIALNVFATNEPAVALYTSLGYGITRWTPPGQLMAKDL